MLLNHPEVPTCHECRRWWYDPRTWRRVERPRGTPLLRGPHQPTPCASCPKSGDGTPKPEADLSERNWRAWAHYQRCKAVGRFPDDPIVVRNAGLIRCVEDAGERAARAQLAAVLPLIAMGVGRGKS